MNKAELRKQIRQTKKLLTDRQKKTEADAVCAQLHKVISNKHGYKYIVAYWPLPDEIDIREFVKSTDRCVYLPVMANETLELRLFCGEDDLDNNNYYGIGEPVGAELLPADADDQHICFIVPGMAFDQHGNRLGRGKGFYDKTLRHFPRALKIGVCYACQSVDYVPTETTDIPMDIVLTADL